MKPLVFIPSPRDIPEVKEAVNKIKLDKLWVKYHEQELAYVLARNWFLESEENYTHFVILPDDLICTHEQIETLLKHDLSVVSGWCAVDKVHDDSNISMSLPPNPPAIGRHEEFQFLKIPEIEYLRSRNPEVLLPVSFSGFAPAVINRYVIEHVPFRASSGCCVDSCFSIDLAYHMLQQFVDLTVKTIHLKVEDSKEWYSSVQTGKKKPEIRYETSG